MEIAQLNLEEWMEVLKPYQIKTINSLIQDFDEEEAAKRWIESSGPINTATFGGLPSNEKKNYFQYLKNELHKLICDQNEYVDERKKIFNQGELINATISYQMAVVLSHTIGLSISLVLPALILLLHTISKISINAYCSMSENEKEVNTK